MSSLNAVDFFDTDGTPIDGLVSIRRPTGASTADEQAVIRQAEAMGIVDFVFFRRFPATEGRCTRSSQILAYVINNSNEQHSKEDLADLHHKLWLQGQAPLIYIAWPASVDILSCARQPDFWDEQTATIRYAEAESINVSPLSLAAEISDALGKRRRLSANRLANGTFWEDAANQKLAKDEAAAHCQLIQAIVEADAEIKGAENPVRRRLLVLMVLITYLEDRGVFPLGHFGRYRAGVRSFRELLQTGTVDDVTCLLRHFEKKFNGDVFTLPNDDEVLTSADMACFSMLVEGKTLGRQKHFWQLFNFRHIPVEVISRLYQRFVEGHGAVYTPPMLVSLLLDQVLPYDRMTGNEQVLDPTCGSGIFLVGAFKRLVIHWRSQNLWQRPPVDVLKLILARSIHGVEMEAAAVDLTAFSLALALCDFLDPPVIWSDLKFDQLRGRNLREGDFFAPATVSNSADHNWPTKFDIIVGNPPFESKLTPAAQIAAKARPKDQPTIPDSNAAYLFLEHGIKALRDPGAICLIQPHGLLYNSNTADFRRQLMKIARLDAVLDFVSMRGLFDGADPKTIAWHATQGSADKSEIDHLTFRRTYSASERIGFEIDHYDWHKVSRADAKENLFTWRIGLLGGGRLREISSRLQRMSTLAQWIEAKGDDWDYGEGFIAGKTGKRLPAPFLTGLPLIPTKAFSSRGLDRTKLGKNAVEETLFKSPYTESRYCPPLILIKAHARLPSEFWNDGPIAYRDKIIGIHAPPEQVAELKSLHDLLVRNQSVFQFTCILNGTQQLTGKATVPLKQDIDRIPMPSDPSDLDLAFWEDALKDDVLNYMADFVRLGQGSALLKKAANEADVDEYSSLYVRMLGSVYRNLKAGEPTRLNGLIAQPFHFGDKPEVEWLEKGDGEALERLIYAQGHEALRIVRVVRYYENNVILFVKPDRLRYWIKSTAIRDADDTLVDLQKQGW